MFTFVGALRSTCTQNNQLAVCSDYKEFIIRIKDYDAVMYEIITGYLSINNNKFLLCYAAEDDATDEAIEDYQLFSVIGDKIGNIFPLHQSLNAIYKQLNISIEENIMFSMLGARQISKNIIRVPIVIVKNDYGDNYYDDWITEVTKTDKTFEIIIPDNIVPFEWV